MDTSVDGFCPHSLTIFLSIMGQCCVTSLTGMSDIVTLIYIYWWQDMQSTAALGLLQSQSTRPCLDFSRLTLYPINLLADFKLSSFTIPHFKVSEHILARYAIPLEDGLSLTSTALKVR